MALKGDGTAWVWGWNGHGALGDGTHDNQLSPELVSGIPGMTIVAGGGYHSLAAATSDVVSTTTSTSATAGNNALRLLGDSYGKLLLVSVNAQGGLTTSWSNDGGATWTGSTLATASGYSTPSWALGPDGTLHLVYKGPTGLAYQHLTISRDSNNNVTGVATAGSAVVLDSSSAAQQPTLALDKVGYPAVAWVSGSWSVHFLRATDDPTLQSNWVNAQGSSSSPDVLGSQSGSNIQGSAVLLHMPANSSSPGPNDDALYLFWTEGASAKLWWSKAVISGSAYSAWSTPDNKAAAIGGSYGIAGAADVTNSAVVVAAETGTSQWRIDRKQGANDADGSDTALLATGSTWGEQLSLGIDRGDVYAVYKNSAANIAYRKYLPEKGWDTAETVPDTSSANDYPNVRADASEGQVDLVWTRHAGTSSGDQARHSRVPSARPAIDQLANTGIADPSASTTARVTSTLNDDKSPSLTGNTNIVDCHGNSVRALFSGSQTRGAQSLVWDGKDNLGNPLTPGNYTVQASSTDTDDNVLGQAMSSAQVSKRQSTTTYTYDNLYRLTAENPPEGQTTYTYDPVGNRLTRVRCGTTDTYSYDQADRMQSVSTNDGHKTTNVNYVVNNDGNVVARGHDYFLFDQANRMTKSAVRQPTKYAYNGDGLVVQSNVGTGPYTTRVWDVNGSLPLLLYDGNRKYIYGATGLEYAVDGNSQLEIYHTDGLGSVRAVTYANGNVVQTYGTDAFGVPAADLTQGTANQPMQYAGEYSDKEDGFSYLRARYYDPGTGRFMQADPLRKSAPGVGGWNRYTYTTNNPSSRIAPTGHCGQIYAQVEQPGPGPVPIQPPYLGTVCGAKLAIVPLYAAGNPTGAVAITITVTSWPAQFNAVLFELKWFNLSEPGGMLDNAVVELVTVQPPRNTLGIPRIIFTGSGLIGLQLYGLLNTTLGICEVADAASIIVPPAPPPPPPPNIA